MSKASSPRILERPFAVACFTIPGAPRTKKNNARLDLRGRRPRKLPSKAFEEWNRAAQLHLRLFLNRTLLPADTFPIRHEVNCRALFYRHALVGDANGFYQALADALEEAGIVEDDSLIVSWDGSRLRKDSTNPRIEVVLEQAESSGRITLGAA